jgi:hypothetical protein
MSIPLVIALIVGFLLGDVFRWAVRNWHRRRNPLTADPMVLQVASTDARHTLMALDQAPTGTPHQLGTLVAATVVYLVIMGLVALATFALLTWASMPVSSTESGILLFVFLLALIAGRISVLTWWQGRQRRVLRTALSHGGLLSWSVNRSHLELIQDGRPIAQLNRDEVRDLFDAKPV